MRLVILLVVLALAAHAPSALAVPLGAHARVTTRDGRVGVGDVLALDADTLSLAIRNEARPLDLALPDVALLELRTDSRSNAKAGAIWGLVVGALSGLILSGGEAADQGSNGSEVAATAAVVCGLAGAAAGALIGAAIHTEHWQTVSPPWTTGSLHGRPSRPGGASVGLVFVRF